MRGLRPWVVDACSCRRGWSRVVGLGSTWLAGYSGPPICASGYRSGQPIAGSP